MQQLCRTSHCHCLICGTENPLSMGLTFHPALNEKIETTFNPPEWMQGYCSILHGGVIASLLDAAMTHCLFQHGVEGVTAHLQVRYHHPSPCTGKESYQLKAKLISSKRKSFRLEAWLCLGSVRTASAEAVFMLAQK